ncbi:MAG: DNA replication/repair protein RecF [Candidatus Nanopelagicales bacterium]|nr:DNA replication/repair protein RecF [Candidatus Nanopelagicales bacterium]
MWIKRLQLTDFRSYSEAVVDFDPGPNVIQGRNGAGKTNLLESVSFLSTLSSHRVAASAPLVRAGCRRSHIGAELIEDGRSIQVQVRITPGQAVSVTIGGASARPRDLPGLFRTVLFAPEDLAIVKGDPANRRSFIDHVLIQRAPRYHSVISDLERVVRQRTALLRSALGHLRNSDRQSVEQTLGVWDDQLVSTGAELLRGRLKLIDEMSEPVAESYRELAPHSRAGVSYHAKSLGVEPDGSANLPRDKESLAELMREVLIGRREEELARGQTLVGPHRDDVFLSIDGMPARGYASHGESWSLALALRLGSFRVLWEVDQSGSQPVLLLDDVFAELDAERRSFLASFAAGVDQCLITVAVAEDVPERLGGRRLDVVGGSGEISSGQVKSSDGAP